MASLSEMIQLAEFKQKNARMTQDRLAEFSKAVVSSIEKYNERRRKQENQKKLSDIMASGDYEASFSVGEDGKVKTSYKPKKDSAGKVDRNVSYSKSVRDYMAAIRGSKSQEEADALFESSVENLSIDYPKLFNESGPTYNALLKATKMNFAPAIDTGDGDIGGGKDRKPPKEPIPQTDVGFFDIKGRMKPDKSFPVKKKWPVKNLQEEWRKSMKKMRGEKEGEKDQYGFTPGEVKKVRNKSYKYLGDNKWQEL